VNHPPLRPSANEPLPLGPPINSLPSMNIVIASNRRSEGPSYHHH
ncbi:hypothetical protein A2U01_0028738, partial [Trifolium medium]|nr:hypothetical protein [Trifolium medium]